MHTTRTRRGAWAWRLGMGLLAAAAAAPASAQAARDPAEMTLEELLGADVQTASRKSQRLQDVPAAAYVITREDIERAGVTTLPDALRLAPGITVGRLSANRYAVSARGFAGRFANKLLVLVDGRSIYSQFFSGVIWEAEDTLLEDIDRIEVIRGPGAALWGANAVNGVINVITRKAGETQGTLATATATAGSDGGLTAALRHGVAGGGGHLRGFVKADRVADSEQRDGGDGHDGGEGLRVGFRGDWPLGGGRQLNVAGGLFRQHSGDAWNLPDLASPSGATRAELRQRTEGAHLVARHEWLRADGSEAVLQTWINRTRLAVRGQADEQRTTFDVDFQHRLLPGPRHDVVWGLNYRESHDEIDGDGLLSFEPRKRRWRLLSAFAQDEWTLQPERLRLVLGARLETNSWTGFSPQPNARLVWTPTPQETWWTALSRAVRTPSRAERDAAIDAAVVPAAPPQQPLPVLLRALPTDEDRLRPEVLTALELGWRRQIGNALSLDVAGFVHRYRDLRSGLTGQTRFVPGLPPYLLQPFEGAYNGKGATRGVELALDWRPDRAWRLQGTLSTLRQRYGETSGDVQGVTSVLAYVGSAPSRQGSLRLSYTPAAAHQFDGWLRRVGALDALQLGRRGVPAYTELDLRYAWKPTRSAELSVTGRNLLDARHVEFEPDLLPSQVLTVGRVLALEAAWTF